MTEVTRVPLQPISRSSLGKLWIGIAATVIAAGGVAWATQPAHVTVQTIKPGTGPSPTVEDVALINYKGTLDNGTVFDQQNQAVLPLQGVVPGFTKALEQMQRGGKYHVRIPASLGYGAKRAGPIPPNSTLNFDIELIDYRNRAEIEQQQRMMEQLQQMQGAQQAPGGAAPAPGARATAPQP
ncbi:MAG: FKBP-type peptidyl-prolyl cis-trans isomerase [Novosphingobium sp.]|nr:FKBP-type peptidyl-prolyl cis-trans isomerase [Novosphingobium sp.]